MAQSRFHAPLFRHSDERDEHRAEADLLARAANLLPLLARDPVLVGYRLVTAGADTMMLPAPADLAKAVDVLERAAACLRDSYRQRVRPDDDPDPWRVTDGSLEDEVAF